SGKGAHLEVSMLEALGEWMGYPLYYSNYGGKEPKRMGASHATIYPYGPFNTINKTPVFLGIQNEREWKQFCEKVIKQPDLVDDPRFKTNAFRVENQHELGPILSTVFDKLTADELIKRLDDEKIANARLNTMKQ